MKQHFSLIILISTLMFLSCKVRNFTTDNKTTCSVHNMRLKKKLVKAYYGKPFSRDVRTEKCPYAKGKVNMGCMYPSFLKRTRFAKIYTCDSCTKVFKIYKQNLAL